MPEGESIFGADPNRLKRLVDMGLDADEATEQRGMPTASMGGLLEGTGSQIGRYKLLDCLGEGGMGVVYLAEQMEPIRRRVALKLVKPGMDSQQVINRFEAERQALALLDHPHIARVYDAGTTDHGRPYFVMEYVKGLTLTEYCDQHKLNIPERIALFQKVCQAVGYAHRKGIIHRDLKPSNILISTDQGQIDPKIIDFGVSKAISQPLTEHTLYTAQGHWVGTPEYMSPEQARHGGEEIGNRSDIYSLGVVLYQLLTGVLPFDFQRLREEGVERVRHVICEEDPKTPSTKLSSMTGEQCQELARKRGTDRRNLDRVLHGDLDWITIKALEKNPAKRYATAEDLAEDLARSLGHEPIEARAIGPMERTLRRVRRRPWATATAASVLLAVLLGALLVWRHVTAPVAALSLPDIRTMAILPFTNASDHPDYGYVMEGIFHNLVQDLMSLPQLEVANESSVLQFAGQPWNAESIRKILPVEAVLRGSLTKDAEVHLEIVDLKNDHIAWQRALPFEAKGARTIHKEIGRIIRQILERDSDRSAESRFDQRYTSNAEAYQLYLKARHAFGKYTPEGWLQSIDFFQRALEKDADFALAHADLASLYVDLGMELWSPQRAFPIARKHAEKALQLDPNLAEAHIALSGIALFYDYDWTQGRQLFEQAQALNPKLVETHPCALHGRFDSTDTYKSLPFVRGLLDKNPLSFLLKVEVGCASYYAGEFGGSIDQYKIIQELNPSYAYAYYGLGRAYAQRGDYDEAIKVLTEGREPLDDWPILISELGYVYGMAGEQEHAQAMLSLLNTQAETTYVDPYLLAMVHMGMGDQPNTLSELRRALEINSTWLPWLKAEPKFKPLHDHPEFIALLEQVGLKMAEG